MLWIPRFSTRTERSRATLPSSVSFGDAVFNVGRASLLVAALAAGDVDALVWATQDRLHQDIRLAAAVPARTALADGLEAGAWCGWLSGSGPTVALLCEPARADAVAAALTGDATTTVVRIATRGRHGDRHVTSRRASTSASSARARGSGRSGDGGSGARAGQGAGRRSGDAHVHEAGAVDHPGHVAPRDLERSPGEQSVHSPARLIAPSSADRRSRAIAASS